MHKPPNCFHIFRCWAHGRSPWPLVIFEWCSASLEVRSARATRNISHDSWPLFHTHVVSLQKSPLQICRVSHRIWYLLSAPVSCPCWNRKCEGTRGNKHSCCATPNLHTTPLGTLSGEVPCSQTQCTYSHTAISWRFVELVSKLFDTPTYMLYQCQFVGRQITVYAVPMSVCW